MIEYHTQFGVVERSSDLQEELKKYLERDRKRVDFKVVAEIELMFASEHLRQKGYALSSNIRLLDAHGNVRDGEYYFVECLQGKRYEHKVERWIDTHHTNYDALFIMPCNPPSVHLKQRKSFLVYPKGLSNPWEFIFHPQNTLYHIIPPARFKVKK